ncbi:MAG TPA: nickel pincer cofactor biosynthesis protein LarB [Deferrisomatales bacterium]|nr:nickel pincer cofactor biosynthesis protein LarB [Deferrisomatales bacterium]
MSPEHLRHLLESLRQGEVTTDEVMARVKTLGYEDLGFAKIDHHRRIRNGYPEVIYGEGKTPAQVAEIFRRLADRNPNVLCTRASDAAAEAVRAKVPGAVYHELCRIVALRRDQTPPVGRVALAAAGTSDLPVAEEAAISLEVFGSRVERMYDVGVAGIHRLLSHSEALGRCNCVVAVAGMEGALPSVVAGLVDVPVIAVPTSVGYGASFGGITALLAMLNSCASGISVVNIDNGFGAAYQADMINKLAARGRGEDAAS